MSLLKYLTAMTATLVFLTPVNATAIEKPEYEVIDRIGDVEIRRYAPHNVARTFIAGDFDNVTNRGFRRLAGYIFGSNDSGTKIAMTAPVAQIPDTSQSGQGYWMTFMMPTEHRFEDLPAPNDANVEIVHMPERVLAVMPYRGNWSQARYRKYESALMSAVTDSSWQPTGVPEWSRYDHPMVPTFFRNNEIGIAVTRAPQISRGER